MDNRELDALLETVHQELAQAPDIDEKGRELLQDLKADIQAALGRPAPAASPLMDRLNQAITHLEATHPDLTKALSNLINSLSNAGL